MSAHGNALPRLEPAGLDGWLVRLFAEIDEANLAWLTAFSRRCEETLGDALVDLVPSYTTLLVVFDPLRLDPEATRHHLLALLASLEPDDTPLEAAPVRELPVWYDPSVGPDLERVAARADCDVDGVVARHSARVYRVFALGFAPGFAFMGKVEEALATPRLATPRQRVPLGSVALAGRQTAAYPMATPGGWNLLGRTAAVLFDRERDGFSLLRVGDRVRFVPVDRATFVSEGGDPTPMTTQEAT